MTFSAFLDALGADGPAADRAGKMDLYGGLIGSWDLDVTRFLDDGSKRQRPGEWHFGWILEGRAIQDVWIVPRRGELRRDDAAANAHSCGTTLRIYDPRIEAWRIQWIDPVTENFLSMIGRKQADDIVQSGTNAEGRPVRWSFSHITPDSFRWRGETACERDASGTANWRLDAEFFALRVGGCRSCRARRRHADVRIRCRTEHFGMPACAARDGNVAHR